MTEVGSGRSGSRVPLRGPAPPPLRDSTLRFAQGLRSSELRGQQSVATDDRREPQGQSPGRSGEIRRRASIGRSEAKSKVITASTMKKPLSNQAGVAGSRDLRDQDL